MKSIIFVILTLLIFLAVSCSHSSSNQNRQLDEIESLMVTNKDSVMSKLDAIDSSELVVDSLRAKYYYLKSWGHMRQNRSMIGDSLISFAHNYYSGKPKKKILSLSLKKI